MKKILVALMLYMVSIAAFGQHASGIIDVPSGIEPLVGFPAPVQDSIGPLLGDIAYNQGKPYNNMLKCYGISSQAVAMAMIARYWQWPNECVFGSLYEYCDGWMHLQKFTFDWANMKTQYTGIISDDEYPESQAQQDEVAELLFACENILAYCLELEMYEPYVKYKPYEPYASASYIIGRSVRHSFEYLSYKSTSHVFTVKDLNTESKLITGLIGELDAGRPVYCEGYLQKDGESSMVSTGYVIDGYVTLQGDKNLTAPYFHFNFGLMNCQNNGWYRITGNKDRSIYSSLNMIFYLEPDIPTENEMIFNELTQDKKIENNHIYIQSNGKRYDILGREIQ